MRFPWKGEAKEKQPSNVERRREREVLNLYYRDALFVCKMNDQ